jgi:hypothetical protein
MNEQDDALEHWETPRQENVEAGSKNGDGNGLSSH